MYYRKTFIGIFVIVALAAAAWWSIDLARADIYFRAQTPESIAEAIAIAPQNTAYLAFDALQNEYDGKDSRAQWEEMARLNPSLAMPRIRLGLAAELRADPEEAERWLLEAAAVDRQFETRWTLANFYFRQDRDAFWTWIQAALEMSYSDRKPAFDLCWRKGSSPAEILERAIPERAEVAAAYVWYLLAERHIDAVAPAALRVNWAEPLLAAVDALLDAGHAHEATEVWRAAGYTAPSGILHPHFEEPRIGHGFDWRFARQDGVTQLALDAPAGHRVRLSGAQAESCELLRQVVGGLRPGVPYRLRWQHHTNGLPAVSGIEWRIAGRSAALESGALTFTAPAEFAVLELRYQRPRGEVRAEGSVDLLEVAMEAQR